MFHHESENEWKLGNSMAVFKKPTSKSTDHFHCFWTTRKTTATRIHFFVRSGGTGSFHRFFCLASKSWDFPKDRQENGGKQWLATRNPTTKESVNWCSLTFENPQLPAVSDPPTCKSNKANSTSGAGGRGWWNFTPSKNLQWLLLWWSSLTLSSRNHGFFGSDFSIFFFSRNWVFNDLCSHLNLFLLLTHGSTLPFANQLT